MKTLTYLRLTLLAKTFALGLACSTSSANAATPVGYWNLQAFSEPALNFVVANNVCFLSNGSWYSISFPGANGHWFQKGDRIRMTAYSIQQGVAGIQNHALFGQFATNTLMAGEYVHFSNKNGKPEPDSYDPNGNFTGTFISRICPPPPPPTLLDGK